MGPRESIYYSKLQETHCMYVPPYVALKVSLTELHWHDGRLAVGDGMAPCQRKSKEAFTQSQPIILKVPAASLYQVTYPAAWP